MGAETTVERDLGLGADPAPDAVAADQHNEAAAGVDRLLQAVEPEITFADAVLVVEHGETMPFELSAEVGCRVPVVAAVAQEDVIMFRHPVALRAGPGGLVDQA